MKVGVCLIATGKYKQFVQPLLEGIEKYFLTNHDVSVFLFTDEVKDCDFKYKGELHNILIPSYGWPFATLFRYKLFDENKEIFKDCSHLFYIDVDMRIEAEIKDDQVLCDGLLNVYHPGFYRDNGWGSNGVDRRSKAWVEEHKRTGYVCGGFNGGRTDYFLTMCNILNARIEADEVMGVRAEHNDESHINFFNKYMDFPTRTLSPSYCMVEDIERRKAWGIDHLEVKIVALNKDHKSIRS